mgnify:FL=1|jgi:hypothetical protein
MVLISVVIVTSGCSSNKISKNHSKTINSYEDVWDHLKISKKERALVDSITNLDEFIVFTDLCQKYLEKKKSLNKGEDIEKTKEFNDYAKAYSTIFGILDTAGLSVDASVAVFDKAFKLRK